MKKILVGIVAIVFFLGVLGLVVLGFLKHTAPEETVAVPSPHEWQIASDLPGDAGTQSQTRIIEAFHAQVPDSSKVVLPRIVVAGDYGLADWTDGYTGGTALFGRDSSAKWSVLLMDGGVISGADMIRAGVPPEIVKQLTDTILHLETSR